MTTLPLGDIDLYWERHGQGPRLLFVNGSGATIESAAPLIDAFARHFEVVVHDQRGLGRTTVPERQPTMVDFAGDAAALLDHVGWDRANVFGISFGGMVPQELAVTWPERIDRLVLCCTSPGGEGGSSYPLDELATVPPDERIQTWMRLLDSRFDDAWLAQHPGDRAIVDVLTTRLAQPKSDEQQRGEWTQVVARQGHDVWARLGRIASPTSRAAHTTVWRPGPTAKPSPLGSPTPSSAATRAATCSCSKTLGHSPTSPSSSCPSQRQHR